MIPILQKRKLKFRHLPKVLSLSQKVGKLIQIILLTLKIPSLPAGLVLGRWMGWKWNQWWERVGWVGRGAALGKIVLLQTVLFPVCSLSPSLHPKLT